MNIAQRITIDPAAQSYVSQPQKNLIDGEWVNAASGKTFPVYDPSTGEVSANVAEADAADVDLAVARHARHLITDLGRACRPRSGERSLEVSDLILENREELAQLESLDNGKPIAVARAADVPLAADLFHYMAGWATKIVGGTIHFPCPTPRARNITPSRAVNRSESSRRSFLGISRC